jgi:hypothetical protein
MGDTPGALRRDQHHFEYILYVIKAVFDRNPGHLKVTPLASVSRQSSIAVRKQTGQCTSSSTVDGTDGGIIPERMRAVASRAAAGGRACQERREPVHGGFAQTSLSFGQFVTILTSPPGRGSAATLCRSGIMLSLLCRVQAAVSI